MNPKETKPETNPTPKIVQFINPDIKDFASISKEDFAKKFEENFIQTEKYFDYSSWQHIKADDKVSINFSARIMDYSSRKNIEFSIEGTKAGIKEKLEEKINKELENFSESLLSFEKIRFEMTASPKEGDEKYVSEERESY